MKKIKTISIPINIKLLFSRLILSFSLLLVTQVFFYIYNAKLFNIINISELLSIILGALRFAISTIIIYLSPYILLSTIPSPIISNKIYNKISSFFYNIGTILMVAINCVDVGYYQFTFKRITVDFFSYIAVGGDFETLIPQFARDYWVIALVFVLIMVVFSLCDKIIRRKYSPEYIIFSKKWFLNKLAIFIIIIGISFIGVRGGLQLRPLSLIQANLYASNQNTALVLNTPYTLIRTISQQGNKMVEYFKDEELLEQYFNPILKIDNKNVADSLFLTPLRVGRTNVVIIILESFSSEYLSIYNNKTNTYTPFLDSLALKSIVYDGYANGKRSIDGIPTILSSLPPLMEEALITSPYSSNQISSIASILKPFGYNTSFFHGGYNGTMGFDAYAKNVGFDKYYGRTEYNDDKDYDGNWGIFDEPFLQYMVDELSKTKEPFLSSVFTLSSHHPYTIPKKHVGRFPKGTLKIHETVGYVDYALKQFFDKASKQSWYNNTLFVITADHSAQTNVPEFMTATGKYRIPIIFYHPSIANGIKLNDYAQQSDIMPSVLDLLKIDQTIFAFGSSIFDNNSKRFYILHSNGEYLLRMGDYISKYREGLDAELFYTPKDEQLSNNISKEDTALFNLHVLKTKAIIQQFNNRMLNNKLKAY